MKMFFLFLNICCLSAFASHDLLIIGDSHTAGPYGQKLHKKLKNHARTLVTLGHSSSSPYHWIADKVFKLKGGVFQKAWLNQKDFEMIDRPSSWRVPYETPKFVSVLNNIAFKPNWSNEVGRTIRPSAIVVGLGANDMRAMFDTNGKKSWGYNSRNKATQKMISLIKDMNIPCIWIGPPNGKKKNQTQYKSINDYLESTVNAVCTFKSSAHYKVVGCDGVHMNCHSEMDKAERWSSEVSDFIKHIFRL